MTFADELAAWLPGQRWFAGKRTAITGVTITADTVLVDGDPGLRHLIVTVAQDSGSEHYQLLAGVRQQIPDRLRHAVIGPAGPLAPGQVGYDALHDSQLTRWLLAAMARQHRAGALRFGTEPGADIPVTADSLVLTAEQSNTSLVFGEEAILKVFRRPSAGPNADLEVTRALAQRGSPHVAEPLGWLQGTLDGQPAVLAILSRYLRSATDGWSLAATSVRDLYASDQMRAAEAGGDFAPEAHRLGEATAEVHRTLADAFGTFQLPPGAHRDLAGQMLSRLDAALAEVPELAPHADLLASAFGELAAIDEPLLVQRIHGDYHLGQVMRTPAGWVVLDFEGEPAAPPAQRRAPACVLRDVAGMLRSFDYAAWHQAPGHPDPARILVAARDWASRSQAAFCDGYAQAGGTDPRKHTTLLRALILDKAVYEVRYEARHRPSWLPITLESIADA
jgi:maltokinase